MYADNLKCVSGSPATLLSAARFTNMYICLVGQKAALQKCVFLCTSKKVRDDMKCWSVSDTGDKWSVKLDIRDLGGHLDSSLRSGAVKLGFRMSAAIPRVRAVAVFPLDFVGRFRILRKMHLPAALHGAEASLVSISGLRRLRTAFCQASLSGGLRLANPGAVLSLLDGPIGSDPGFHVVWCRFRMLRRHMSYNSSVHELARVYSLLRVVSAGAQFFGRRACFSALSEEKSFLVVFVGVLMVMDICFGSALILLLFTFVKVLEFRDLLLRDRSSWPRCLLGWLPALACIGEASLWAASVDDIACARLERLLGSYSEGVWREWVPPDHFIDSVASSDVSDHPDVWTDGSFVLDELSGIGVGGCGVYSLRSGAGWFDRRWGHLELLPPGESWC